MSAVPDLVYPETRGERPADFESSLKSSAALIRTAMRDPAVHRLLSGSSSKAQAASVLQDPAVDRLVRSELSQMAAE